MTPEPCDCLSPDGFSVGGEGWGEGAARRICATPPPTETHPAHPTLSPKHAWGRGLSAQVRPKGFSNPERTGGRRSSLASLAALLWLVTLTLFSSPYAFAQVALPAASDAAIAQPGSIDGANLDVALYTFGPGEEIWERFGHNAIEIRDRTTGKALLYNYGIFDFGQKDFFLNFARGLMTYRIAAGDPADELPVYAEEGRWIVRQDLNLTPPQRAQLAGFLAWNVRPEHAEYRYDYFTDNCATRVRDAIDAAVGGAIKAQTIAPSRGFTYRMDADRLMQPDLAVMLAMDAGLGPFADQRLSYWAESFVPMEFMRRVRAVQVTDETGASRPLVARETKLVEAQLPEPPLYAPTWVWRALACGVAGALLLGALAAARRRLPARALFATLTTLAAFVLGVGGVVLVALWALTDHVSAWRNENILLFNPLCLLLLPCWIASARARWRPSLFATRIGVAVAACAGIAFFIKVLPAFPQDNRFWIALLLPLHASLALVLLRARVLSGVEKIHHEVTKNTKGHEEKHRG